MSAYTMTPAQAAQRLRIAADMLDLVGPLPVRVYLSIDVCRYFADLPEADRTQAVDAVAATFGLTAAPTKVGSVWEHRAKRNDNGFFPVVRTDIDTPPVCGCGKDCTHDDRSAVPA